MNGSRAALLLQAAALAVVPAALLLVLGLPVASARALSPPVLLLLVAAVALGSLLFAAALLLRATGRPVERLLAAARRLERSAELPMLGPSGDAGGGLSRAAVAFERTAAALEAERARLSQKVAELEQSNAALAAARDQLSRSERLAAVGLLAAGVAHEIGNPLGAIVGYAELARQRLGSGGAEAGGAGAGAARDFLERIAADARRIDVIVRDLLDLARPERIALTSVPLGPVIEDALASARVQERFGRVAVEVALAEGLPPVRADARRLSQVLLNLLLNAADATAGSGTVRISGRRAGDAVELRVADDGPGIAPEHLARVFDPFFTTKPPGKGTGLGLAVSHTLVDAFGGTISAERGQPGGAVFRLVLRPA